MRKFKKLNTIETSQKEQVFYNNKAENEKRFDYKEKNTLLNLIYKDSEWWKGLVPEIENKLILDLGCGTGVVLAYFELIGNSAIGVDISKGELRRAAQTSKTLTLGGKIVNSNIKNLPFKNESFDIIHIRWVIHHLSNREINECMAEIHRIHKKDGQVFLYETNRLYPIRFIVQTSYLQKINIFRKVALIKELMDPEEKALTNNEYINMLEGAGFIPIAVDYEIGFLHYLPSLLFSNKTLTQTIKDLDRKISNNIPETFSINIKIISKKAQ